MKWQEIYKKYKDSELMDKFNMYVYDNEGESIGDSTSNIKDIWGYLICFAETKGISIVKGLIAKKTGINKYGQNEWVELASYKTKKTAEEDMLWCADKFFEVAK